MKLSVSTNPEKESQLLSYIDQLTKLDVDFIHCDVMDGKFVEAKCLSPNQIASIKNHTTIPLDVHFMGYPTEEVVQSYLTAGANIVTLHLETQSFTEWLPLHQMIHRYHRLSGISIRPDTNLDEIDPYLDYVDLVLVMSVTPGKSGQAFLDSTYKRLQELRKKIGTKPILVEVDGGINLEIATSLQPYQVDMVVMGSAFYHCEDKASLYQDVKRIS